MKNKRKLSLWIFNPKNEKVTFDPNKCYLTQTMVDCTLKKVIPGKYSSMVEYTYIHPRLNKKLKGITSLRMWEA